MAGKYSKNFTDQGYVMNYRNNKVSSPYNKYSLQFVICIRGIEPPVWRKILVPSDYNFWDLHVAIQDSMGWLDYHLHHFEIKGKGKKKQVHIGIPDFEGCDDEENEVYPGWEISVIDYFNELGVTANYVYDYGDDWHHHVILEGYIFKDRGEILPRCIDGSRACPPEDCGGAEGYKDLLNILSDENHENFEQYNAWVGGNYNPEHFNKKNIQFHDPFQRWKNAFLKSS